MNENDIDTFLSQLSPAQETVVVLKDIREQLKTLNALLTLPKLSPPERTPAVNSPQRKPK